MEILPPGQILQQPQQNQPQLNQLAVPLVQGHAATPQVARAVAPAPKSQNSRGAKGNKDRSAGGEGALQGKIEGKHAVDIKV